MFFSEIPGHETLKSTLISAVNNQHVAHAQLFCSPEGGAALSLALAYSTYLHCENRTATDACGTCASCILSKKYTHPDTHFFFPMAKLEKIDDEQLKNVLLKKFREFAIQSPYGGLQEWGALIGVENKQFSIGVEESRGILRTVALKPYQSVYKIILVWLPEYMNAAAANAILKVLEEPNSGTLFLLVAQQYDQLLKTITSRCQLVSVPAFTNEETISYLVSKEGIENRKALQIASVANGNFNKALALLADTDDDNFVIFREWMRLCYARDYAALIEWSQKTALTGRENQKNLLQYGINLLRGAIVFKEAGEELVHLPDEEIKFIKGFSTLIDTDKGMVLFEKLGKAFYHIERNVNARAVLMDTSFQIVGLLKK